MRVFEITATASHTFTETHHERTYEFDVLACRPFSNQAYNKREEIAPRPFLTSELLVLTGRNGDITESGADSMADLWASYHSALGLGSKPPKAPTPLATGHSVSFKVEQRF